MKLKFTYKGGAGSGFHGHRGRPGEQGGSLPGRGKPSREDTHRQEISRQNAAAERQMRINELVRRDEEAARQRDAEDKAKTVWGNFDTDKHAILQWGYETGGDLDEAIRVYLITNLDQALRKGYYP